MKKLLATSVIAATAAAGVSAPALAGVSANIGVTSNYIWRGVSQTDDGSAVSGGIDYESDVGFYSGLWVSTVEFADDAGTETDLYLGYGGEAGGFGYDVGYVYYLYTEYDDVDFGELYFNGSFNIVSFGIALTTNNQSANDDVGFEEGDLFYYIGVGGDVGEGWSLAATYGYYDFDSDGELNNLLDPTDNALESYGYFQFDVTKSAGDMGDFTLSIIDAEEESGDDDTKLVVSWGTTFN